MMALLLKLYDLWFYLDYQWFVCLLPFWHMACKYEGVTQKMKTMKG